MPAGLCDTNHAGGRQPESPSKSRALAVDDAILTAAETRSSSPLRILRDESMQSPSARGLFPAGEGAGYAGGILSAAADGLRVARTLATT